MAGGRIGIDFNVPISSCAFVGTCFMASSVLAALAEALSKAQGHGKQQFWGKGTEHRFLSELERN